MFEIILLIVAGLVLFLFAVAALSETIQHAIGENAKDWILKFTSNTFSGILTGTLVTAILDSSSAVIILTIIFVNSNLLTLRQAMAIVLGANIGTTIGSQIIALDLGKYAPVFMALGFGASFLTKSEKAKDIGKVVFYFGMLFYGLFTMEEAVEPLKKSAFFVESLQKAENPIIGSLLGAFVTLVIQSSSATVGIAIILSKQGLLGLGGGIAIMLGAELGTCSDTLLATIKGSRKAIKTGFFHLIFNFLSIVLGLIFFYPFVQLVSYIGQNMPVEKSLANAHLIFNVSGVLLFGGLIPFFERWLNKIIPEKTDTGDNEKNMPNNINTIPKQDVIV